MNAQEILATNLRRLMDHYGYSQTDVAAKAGVSQKNVSDILRARGKFGPGIAIVQDICERCFKITIWHIMMPNCPDELLFNHSIEKLVDNFIHNDKKGRDATLSVSEIRAQDYIVEQKKG
ncbi:helix-turn-helix domain-containing protein [Methylomonas sp. MED-D]|uniref:helix-turn-helix domain-containing protein n=1 Tax=Methylomonas sp. MED-D TaxID=3418768 RepID=UPI003CFF8300